MALTLETKPVPLRVWEDGSIRVAGTRVFVDLVIHAYQDGRTPEQIVASYDTLQLADVYSVIAYYLQNKEQVDAYLRERERLAEEVRRENERRFPTAGLKERLLARLDARQRQVDTT